MRALIQRVAFARVLVEEKMVGKIGNGMLVLLGVGADDHESDADYLSLKISKMRIFNDESGKMNLDLANIQGSILVVSQFTLWADTKRGNRPGFSEAAKPEKAMPLYEYFIERLEKDTGKKVKKGIFGADMKIELVNSGPVTIWVDSKDR